VVCYIILYPEFEAVVLRWWLSGIRLGGAAVTSGLRKRPFYGAYLKYILFVFLLFIVFLVIVGMLGVLLWAVLPTAIDPAGARGVVKAGPLVVLGGARGAVMAGAFIVAYVLFLLACSAIYQVVVKLRLCQVAFD
jgi:hypothetical protein